MFKGDVQSNCENDFIRKALNEEKRIDGREFMEARQWTLHCRRHERESQAEIQLGQTRVLAVVQGDIVAPRPDRPTEGILSFTVEISPMASPSLESGRTSPLAVELSRLLDRNIRKSRALDTEALTIVPGEKVWAIRCVVHVLDHGGNLTDAVSLATTAALLHFRRPVVAVHGTHVTLFSADERRPQPLSLHHLPLCVSYSFFHPTRTHDPLILLDPTQHEEEVLDGKITFTFNSFQELCAVHQCGGLPVSTDVVMKCTRWGQVRAREWLDEVKANVAKADADDTATRHGHLRGQAFVATCITDAFEMPKEVDLGTLTQFNAPHQPIPLAASETNLAPETQQLMHSLKAAAQASLHTVDMTSGTRQTAKVSDSVTELEPNTAESSASEEETTRPLLFSATKNNGTNSMEESSSEDDEDMDLSSALK